MPITSIVILLFIRNEINIMRIRTPSAPNTEAILILNEPGKAANPRYVLPRITIATPSPAPELIPNIWTCQWIGKQGL